MLDGITERSVKKVTELHSGELEEDNVHHETDSGLLIAVIVLSITAVVLLLVILYGYCKYVKKGVEDMEEGRRNRSRNMREEPGDIEQPSVETERVPESPKTLDVPVKMRKRSMTFSETDEECRKYREDLADSYDRQPETVERAERFRKKSVVTFAGVEVIDTNDS